MTLYETIFKRRAVRKFDNTPLANEVVNDIKKYILGTQQFEGQNARFKIVSANAVNNNTAPHYILAFCEDNYIAYANVGYILEKADLYIQSKDLGSLWLGMARPNEKENDFCIMLAFGKTDVPLRKSEQEFNRLPLGEISNADNSIASSSRLAPSAINSQPWKLHFDDGKVVIKYFGRGLTKLILKKKFNKIDLGIITRHIEVALLHEGKNIKSIMPKITNKSFEIEVTFE